MPAYPHLSLTVDQAWADKDQPARVDWFDTNADAIARSRGAVINALADHAALIARTKAHDDRVWSAERYINDVIDALDATLAEEVRAWLDSVPAPVLTLVAAQ